MIDERVRRRLILGAREELVRLVVPATALAEFLLGHHRDSARAHRVLDLMELAPVSPAIARRAADLLIAVGGSRTEGPSISDGIVAAFGEIAGAVATHDAKDMTALAGAGLRFDIYPVSELLETLRP